MRNEKNEKMINIKKTCKKEKMEKTIFEDSHATSSTISKVFRCCCTFFSRNPSRLKFFGMCIFPMENQQPHLERRRFCGEK